MTLQASYSASGSNSSQEFSRANLFSMFMTLQLCQLTQPYGSLLFRGSSGFFWRVNPIASFVEALMIATYLLGTIWQSLREGHRFEMIPWGKKMRATASALLLLRGALEDEDGELMGKLMNASLLDEATSAESSGENEVSAASGENAGEGVPNISASFEMGHVSMESGNRNPPAIVPQHRVLRRQTSQLESAPPTATNNLTSPDPSDERSLLLHAAFGPNALAHREMRIDIATAVSVLGIFVKLLWIRSLWVFLTAAHFMVYGWLLVQSLLPIFHSREMSELDMELSLQAARSLDAMLREHCSN